MPFEYRNRFSRMMFLEMDALLGTEAAGDVSFEARGIMHAPTTTASVEPNFPTNSTTFWMLCRFQPLVPSVSFSCLGIWRASSSCR